MKKPLIVILLASWVYIWYLQAERAEWIALAYEAISIAQECVDRSRGLRQSQRSRHEQAIKFDNRSDITYSCRSISASEYRLYQQLDYSRTRSTCFN